MLSETKIDESFPNSHFFAEGHQMTPRDRNMNGGGFPIYVKENTPIDIDFEELTQKQKIHRRN